MVGRIIGQSVEHPTTAAKTTAYSKDIPERISHRKAGKLASLNRSWQSNKGTFSASGMAGIEPMPSHSSHRKANKAKKESHRTKNEHA